MTTSPTSADAGSDLLGPAPGIAPAAPVKDASTRRGRYEFLDALRGVAAMGVVLQHGMELAWPAWARFSVSYFRPGEFGVVLFFLCSGFIIPASLERHGSQARFWIGRFFRLYPLYWSALGAVLVLHFVFGRYPLDRAYLAHPLRMTVANVTMLQDFVGAPLALGQSWTLAYELVFYGVVAALFVAGLHRKSVPIALAGFALAAAPLLGRVPSEALAHPGPKLTAGIVLATLGAALAMAWLARGAGRVRWLAVGIAAAVVPLVLNRPETLNTACFFFATFFAGTALYRWTTGQVTTTAVAALVAVAAVAIVVLVASSTVDGGPGVHLKRAELVTYLAAYAVFLAALAVRDARFPRVLLYLGVISYSLYLDHSLVIYACGWLAHSAVVTVSVWTGGTIVLSALTYRFIERPAIDAGHRLGRRFSARTA